MRTRLLTASFSFPGACSVKLIVGLVALLGIGGGLALTNPSPDRYAENASYRLVEKLQTEACDEVQNALGIDLQGACRDVVAELRPQLQTLIKANTERINLVVMSHYKTSLTANTLLPEFLAGELPSYEVESLGAATQVLIYRAEEVPAPEQAE